MRQVIIIGAGVAGLAAANRLRRNGVEILIIEARDRIGGRILTTQNAHHVPVELGAEFIHGRPPEIFDMVKSARLHVAECSDQRLIRRQDRLSPLDDFWDIIERVDSQLDPSSPATYQQFLDTNEAAAFDKEIAKSYVEGFNAARAERIGEAAVLLEEKAAEQIAGDHQYRLVEGYQVLLKELAAHLPADCIRTGHPMQAIRWKRHAVTVEVLAGGMQQSFQTERALITVPIGVLRATAGDTGAIIFDPPLAEKRCALEKIEPGHVMKFVAHFREPFWRPLLPDDRREVGFALCLEAAFPTWWDNQPIAPNALTGWAGGTAAEALIGRGKREILGAAVSSLAKTFGVADSEIERQLESWDFHNWSADPFSRCAYSYPGVGGIEAARKLAESLAETLFFAGEATDFRGHNGTVQGAIHSGLRAADEVLASI